MVVWFLEARDVSGCKAELLFFKSHMGLHLMNFLKQCFAALLFGLAVSVAHATSYTTTVNGTAYNFSTIAGSFESNYNLLSSQPWFGDFDAANQFVTAVWDNLGGAANFGEVGPFFAWETSDGFFSFQAFAADNVISSYYTVEGPYTFAVATAVPELDGSLLAQALGLLVATAFLFHRRQINK